MMGGDSSTMIFILFLFFVTLCHDAFGWMLIPSKYQSPITPIRETLMGTEYFRRICGRRWVRLSASLDIIDVPFERTSNETTESSLTRNDSSNKSPRRGSNKDSSARKKKESNKTKKGDDDPSNQFDGYNFSTTPPASLLELSLALDPEWNETRVPFIDVNSIQSETEMSSLDVKLAFMAELDGVSYGIGIPADPVVAVAMEAKDGTVTFLNPDDDESEEWMQLMATQLQQHLGDDLYLRRTPRVLTVVGPLDKYTADWKELITPKPWDIEALLGDGNDDLNEEADIASFHNFMKEELGEDEYHRTLNEDPGDIPDQLRALFDIPGLGTQTDDETSISELFNSIFDETTDSLPEELQDIETKNAALKLVGYILPNGAKYFLVQILTPFVVVGRFVDAEKNSRFELLSQDEASLIEPRLSEVCQQDLEKAGWKLPR